MAALQIEEEAACAGRTLSELNLRGRTGASVLAILRDGHPIVAPNATDRLLVADIVALTGTQEAIGAARETLMAKRPTASNALVEVAGE